MRCFLGFLLSFFVLQVVPHPLPMAPQAAFGETRDERLEALFRQPRYQTARWGLLFVDQETGDVVLERNPDQLFIPASVTKLYSVANALDALGADRRFVTPVHRRGTIDATQKLHGDLILVASGDLTLGGRTTDKDEIAFTNNDHTYANGPNDTQLTAPNPLAGIEQLAQQIARSGIRSIQGDIIVDDLLFERAEGTGSGPSRVTPIMINDNLIDVEITPTKPGKPAEIMWRPQTNAIRLETNVSTVKEDDPLLITLRDLGDGRLHVIGQIPANHRPIVRVFEVADAASHARTLLIEALLRRGIPVTTPSLARNNTQRLPDRREYRTLPVVAKLESPAFAESARLILKVSHNLHASTLPLLVAAQHGERTLADGLRRQGEFLRRVGVDVDTISFGGGAGGDRADHVTPRATVQLLRAMQKRPDFAVYERALPSLGVDGTLAKSVQAESDARGKVQAKTGTLSWNNVMNGGQLLTSKALAGYLTTATGRKLVFAAFVNNVHLREGLDANAIGRDLGQLCEIMHASE
ncbi:MAG: D-alanyl-D-alanine carboxypeptidase/D-alanyl-D-alanine-endopeptidase [Planctomycetota bacterium]